MLSEIVINLKNKLKTEYLEKSSYFKNILDLQRKILMG